MRAPSTILLVVALAACSNILGLKDPTVETDQNPPSDAAIDGAPDMMVDAGCVPSACPFGCDTATNMCRQGKLWIFPTAGSVVGNAFGGTDAPPNPRGGADARCRATYTASFTARECNVNNVHAIIHITAADGLAQMAANYQVPVTVQVQRADDAVLVANNWNDLLDSTRNLLAPATSASTDAEGAMWTGASQSTTCRNWTSNAMADEGTRALTTSTLPSWLNHDNFRCDRPARLLCVCWAGGN